MLSIECFMKAEQNTENIDFIQLLKSDNTPNNEMLQGSPIIQQQTVDNPYSATNQNVKQNQFDFAFNESNSQSSMVVFDKKPSFAGQSFQSSNVDSQHQFSDRQYNPQPFSCGNISPLRETQDSERFNPIHSMPRQIEQNSRVFGQDHKTPFQNIQNLIKLNTAIGNTQDYSQFIHLDQISKISPNKKARANKVQNENEIQMPAKVFEIKPDRVVQKVHKIDEGKLKQNKISVFQMNYAAKKIQRFFKTYLIWQKFIMMRQNDDKYLMKLQNQARAAQIIKRSVTRHMLCKQVRAQLQKLKSSVILIQKFWKSKQFRKLIQRRLKAKQLILSLFLGWRTRIITSLLAAEIQEYVHQENTDDRSNLKTKFLNFYDQILEEDLWFVKHRQAFYQRQNQLKKKTVKISIPEEVSPIRENDPPQPRSYISSNTKPKIQQQSSVQMVVRQEKFIDWNAIAIARNRSPTNLLTRPVSSMTEMIPIQSPKNQNMTMSRSNSKAKILTQTVLNASLNDPLRRARLQRSPQQLSQTNLKRSQNSHLNDSALIGIQPVRQESRNRVNTNVQSMRSKERLNPLQTKKPIPKPIQETNQDKKSIERLNNSHLMNKTQKPNNQHECERYMRKSIAGTESEILNQLNLSSCSKLDKSINQNTPNMKQPKINKQLLQQFIKKEERQDKNGPSQNQQRLSVSKSRTHHRYNSQQLDNSTPIVNQSCNSLCYSKDNESQIYNQQNISMVIEKQGIIPKYKKCLNEIESLLESLFDTKQQEANDNKSLGRGCNNDQKLKNDQKFNVRQPNINFNICFRNLLMISEFNTVMLLKIRLEGLTLIYYFVDYILITLHFLNQKL
ncbi:UNKNOWN [Stylonychia lemnae]|uniref:Iq calmodulin-binding motif family protein n=1 Tax=Stylonychia lemnae TaxID=5949 RepID=A0A078AAP1_STYLE|nr:UNKNOWN [Stylonychia lemnae]|eukprot:CDW78906.1 UNKNOWN [Stylonychia lemnae]